ncbi:MAG TPA: EamA family transporter [Candidatus Angelobacter sp.]|nr:EamA family transporter [Candidatus Angelobacter sp.]
MSCTPTAFSRTAHAVPPQLWFLVSAVFHYLGPSFAVLLFARVDVLGVAWFRIASAAAVFALWTRPWRVFAGASRRTLVLLLALGACLAAMNSVFYLAIARLPLSLVATIEFMATIAVALFGLRSTRNYAALALAAIGVLVLTNLRWASDPLGLAFAVLNGLLFIAYIVLGHRIARDGADQGVGRLGAAMAAAFLFVMPIGFAQAVPAFGEPLLILAGIGVGVCSSVIPYVSDQLAMSRLPRNSFALMLALLPATATLVGALVLAQIPTGRDLLGIALVMAGIALHRPPSD